MAERGLLILYQIAQLNDIRSRFALQRPNIGISERGKSERKTYCFRNAVHQSSCGAGEAHGLMECPNCGTTLAEGLSAKAASPESTTVQAVIAQSKARKTHRPRAPHTVALSNKLASACPKVAGAMRGAETAAIRLNSGATPLQIYGLQRG